MHITVEYDGPSLSDTSSLVSLDEYKGKSESTSDLTWVYVSEARDGGEVDDDSVTVSSRDTVGPSGSGTLHPTWNGRVAHDSRAQGDRPSMTEESEDRRSLTMNVREYGDAGPSTDRHLSSLQITAKNATACSNAPRSLSDLSGLSQPSQRSSLDDPLHFSAQERGAAWLRDQNARTIRAMLGATPEPSDVDSRSISLSQDGSLQLGNMGGDLALHRDQRGKYYYSYTGGSSATHDSGYEDGVSCKDDQQHSMGSPSRHYGRPTSMHLSWLASQQKPMDILNAEESTSVSLSLGADIVTEALPVVPLASPPPGSITTCSQCDVLLDSIRYVCAICGEKEPASCKLAPVPQSRFGDTDLSHTYPPLTHLPSQSSSSSLDVTTLAGSLYSRNEYRKPLPPLPGTSNQGPYGFHGSNKSISECVGYELCSGCIESAGIFHALQESTERKASITSEDGSHGDAISLWLRSAPRQKGQLRHAYFERVWGPQGWEDVGKLLGFLVPRSSAKSNCRAGRHADLQVLHLQLGNREQALQVHLMPKIQSVSCLL